MLIVSAATAALTALSHLAPAQAAPPPGGCVVVDGAGQCLVEAADPGRRAGSQSRDRAEDGQREPRAPSRRDQERTPGPREPEEITSLESPARSRGTFGGVPLLGPGGGVGGGVRVFEEIPLPLDEPNAPPVPPAVLAQRAVEMLNLQPPALRMSVSERAYVGVPVWLWVEPGPQGTGPVSATASAGAAVVTATARLTAVDWTLGPPGERIRCSGPGTPWSGEPGPSPDCGYTYALRSLPERTGGSGAWPVTATAIWRVEWTGVSAGAPVSGAQTVPLTTEQSLAVGELHVLVSGEGR